MKEQGLISRCVFGFVLNGRKDPKDGGELVCMHTISRYHMAEIANKQLIHR